MDEVKRMTREEAIEILSGIRACFNFFNVYDEPKYVALTKAIFALKAEPTIKAYTIEDLRDAFRDGQDNECSYHWGVRKAEPWYMKDEVEE